VEHRDVSTAPPLLPLPLQKSPSFLLCHLTLVITFVTTLTILLSASHVHEIATRALQVDESIVMKLMMSSKKGMRGVIHRERIGGGPL
jgi:hypothetical protein